MRITLAVLVVIAALIGGGGLLLSGVFKTPAPLHTNPIIASVMLERKEVCPKETDPKACEKENETLIEAVTGCFSGVFGEKEAQEIMFCAGFFITHDMIMNIRREVH